VGFVVPGQVMRDLWYWARSCGICGTGAGHVRFVELGQVMWDLWYRARSCGICGTGAVYRRVASSHSIIFYISDHPILAASLNIRLEKDTPLLSLSQAVIFSTLSRSRSFRRVVFSTVQALRLSAPIPLGAGLSIVFFGVYIPSKSPC
jgi:hypothetical protein